MDAINSRQSRPMVAVATMEHLPMEIADIVTSHLRPHNLTQLSRASQRCCDFPKAALWRNIELHRRDAHEHCARLATTVSRTRAYLDDKLRDPWSYRIGEGIDFDFESRNGSFNRVVRDLYRSSPASCPGWIRLARHVRHICLTVTHRSPRHIWNTILSLPNLITLEVVGEYSDDNRGPPKPSGLLQAPASNEIHSVRLRGYIPLNFVSALLCNASRESLISLDLGILKPPQTFDRDLEELELPGLATLQPYIAPRSVLWASGPYVPLFSSLTHLFLSKRGVFGNVTVFIGEEYREMRQDEINDMQVFNQWTQLLFSVRSTIVEIVLEQRPVYLDHVLVNNDDIQVSPRDDTAAFLAFNLFDEGFYQHILCNVFDWGGLPWPNLKKLTLRGASYGDLASARRSDDWEMFAQRVLPGVQVELVPGYFMFFNAQKGFIRNQHGADGLKPHLETRPLAEFDSFDIPSSVYKEAVPGGNGNGGNLVGQVSKACTRTSAKSQEF